MLGMWDEGKHSRCYLTHVPLTSDNRYSSDIFCQVINLNRGLLREEEICSSVHLWKPSCDRAALLHGFDCNTTRVQELSHGWLGFSSLG